MAGREKLPKDTKARYSNIELACETLNGTIVREIKRVELDVPAENEGRGRNVLSLYAFCTGAFGRYLPHLRQKCKENDPLGRSILIKKRGCRFGPAKYGSILCSTP